MLPISQQPGTPCATSKRLSVFDTLYIEQPLVCAQQFLTKSVPDLSLKDEHGYSLLHRVCLKGDPVVLAALMSVGVSPNQVTDTGISPVHVAASKGSVIMLSILRRYGARFDQKDSNGRTALYYAIEADQLITVAWLLQFPESGPADQTDLNGVTPIHWACFLGRGQVLRYLLQVGLTSYGQVKWNLFAVDRFGNTCLHSPFCSSLSAYNTSSRPSQPAAKNSAVNVIWSVLNAPHCCFDERVPLALCHIRNKDNKTVLELAKRERVGYSVLMLLYFCSLLYQKFSEPAALTILRFIYLLIFLLFFLIPIIVVSTTHLLATRFGSVLVYPIGLALLVCIGFKQRHRMQDGTQRPNPFFAGCFLSGFFTTFCSYWSDISVSVGWLANHQLVYYVASLFVPITLLVLYMSLVLLNPGHAQKPRFGDEVSVLVKYIEQETSAVQRQLAGELDKHSGRIISDIYCPLCDIPLSPISRMKHCKLCGRCMLGMDHHCLFILNCVANENHRRFILLLICCFFYAGFYCLFSVNTLLFTCPFVQPQDLFQFLTCSISRVPRCTMLLCFNCACFCWALSLLDEQLLTIASRQAVWQRRHHRSRCLSGFRLSHLLILCHFLLHPNRLPPIASEAFSNI